ncbi:MAG: hypothetical protein V4604_11750 [Bacteroidota bacterium]
MKKRHCCFLVLIITSLTTGNVLGQQTSGIHIGLQANLDIYEPYSEFGKEFNDKYNNVSSSTFGAYAFYNKALNAKNTIGFGFCSKYITHKITDKFNYQMYISNPPSGSPDTMVFYDPVNLYSRSFSIGTHLEYNRVVHSKKNVTGLVGIATQFYFLEFFNAHYNESTVGLQNRDPLLSDTPRNFFFSSANVSASYALEFNTKKSISLRLKASLGTNLYSDWDQFSKYVWIGLGGELGIPFRNTKPEPVNE